MKRSDLYIIGLAFLHLTVFYRILSIITAGTGLQMMQSSKTAFVAILFVSAFLLLFSNLAKLARTILVANDDESKALKDISNLSLRFLGVVVIYMVLEFVQALSYVSLSS